MHLRRLICIAACLWVSVADARKLNVDLYLQESELPPTPILEAEEDQDYEEEFPQPDILAEARHRATQARMERILIALGSQMFLKKAPGILNNETYPTVSSPLNITTEPCPEVYMRCSSENFFSSCHPPASANSDLWGKRLNLYFDLPHNLLATDQLLNATLRIYKNNSLPVKPTANLIVELYIYTKSLTKAYDINFMYDSKVVSNDYIGWISFNITDLIMKLDLKDHHGFLIKVKEEVGVYWNDPTLIVPMDCSDENKTVLPVPFGIITDQPEQKFPSLTIHTGMLDQYFYSGIEAQNLDIVQESDQEEDSIRQEGMSEMHHHHDKNEEEELNKTEGQIEKKPFHYKTHLRNKKHKHKRQRHHSSKNMSGDDPKVHEEIYRPDEEESSEPKHQYEVIEGEDLIPIELTHSSNQNRRHRYQMKSFRKPVANQVYNGHISVGDLDGPLPSVLSPSEALPHTKNWRSSNIWDFSDSFGDVRQQENRESKKRLRPKMRHHNQHHQDKSGETHRSHSHFHSSKSHNSHNIPHHSHPEHGTHERHTNKKADDSNHGLDS